MTDIDLEDGEYTAVVDAIEDGLARVFFERDGEEVGDALLDPARLPADARHADAVLAVVLRDGAVDSAAYDPERTTARAEKAQDRFDRLSNRLPSDEDS
ncbi:DUF3006 family protein [Halorubrum sp. AD140]|uniref:DUF3006 family protein n=1 Tax=Halorubrum sp. AD140 TaxID=3050073 RepID=UPI002ACCF064|nr:DUF3006 family protein [Halorubrum sp. AD140]MDZ5810612.1 DUF3006 family protein [Halorubrum sp. AD140]